MSTSAGKPDLQRLRRRHLVTGTPIRAIRRYHSDCHVCHGPDGEGSSYAPALKDSLQTHELWRFRGIVAAAAASM